MSHRLVALDDVLGTLTEEGPLSTDALAHQLRLNKLDARMVLVDAHAHGLVRTNSRGEWSISDLGRDALTAEFGDRRRAALAQDDRWSIAASVQRLAASGVLARRGAALKPRYLARRGLPLAVGAIVGAGGVAVASSRLENATEGPPVMPTHVAVHHHPQQTHTTGPQTVVLRRVRPTHHHKRSTLVVSTARVQRRVPVVHQVHKRPQTKCNKRHQSPAQGARVSGACAGGRSGTSKAGTGGSRNGPHRRAFQHTGVGGGSATQNASSPTQTPSGLQPPT
jgi:hypothetical protein